MALNQQFKDCTLLSSLGDRNPEKEKRGREGGRETKIKIGIVSRKSRKGLSRLTVAKLKMHSWNDPRWLITNISGLQPPVKAQRMRGCHTFRQIFVAHGPGDSQGRSPTGHQRNSCGWHGSFAGIVAWQFLVQSKQDWVPFWSTFGALGRQSLLFS